MKIVGLIDVDGHRFPNLPLMKISAWHKKQNDLVEWCVPLKHYDIVYQAKVFDDTYTPDIDYMPNADKIVKGGTGYGLDNKLPDEIEHIYPDYSLYDIQDTAYGFLTRGCPRHCSFCIVGDKEGLKSVKVADLSEWWNGQKYIKLLDPNITACPERIELIQQLADSKAWIDFTQGIDVRLLNPEVISALNGCKIKMIHFAWDNPRDDLKNKFEEFAKGFRRKSNIGTVYCLTNFNSTMEENLYRIYTLRNMGYDPYVMVYDKSNAPREIKRLQRWCNNKIIFKSCPKFEDYMQ